MGDIVIDLHTQIAVRATIASEQVRIIHKDDKHDERTGHLRGMRKTIRRPPQKVGPQNHSDIHGLVI